MTNILPWFFKLNQIIRSFLIFLIIFIIAYIDYITPKELSIRLFYLIPLFLSAWEGSELLISLFFSFLCTSVFFYTEYLAGNIYHHGVYIIWEFIITWGFFIVFVLIVNAIKKSNIVIAKKNNELKKTNEELNKANIIKDELLKITSHDLKNPLSNIMNLSSFIMDSKNISTEETEKLAGWIHESSKKMSDIINQYLTNNLGNNSNIYTNVKPFPIDNLLERIVKEYHFKASQKNITLNLSCPIRNILVETDEIHTYQVIDNILSNAIKYSPKGKEISISVYYDTIPDIDKQDESIVVQIKDNGPGFQEEDMSKMFNQNTKLSAIPTDGESSTGNGLYIAKKIIEEMKGKIWVESQFGMGSSFFIALRKA